MQSKTNMNSHEDFTEVKTGKIVSVRLQQLTSTLQRSGLPSNNKHYLLTWAAELCSERLTIVFCFVWRIALVGTGGFLKYGF